MTGNHLRERAISRLLGLNRDLGADLDVDVSRYPLSRRVLAHLLGVSLTVDGHARYAVKVSGTQPSADDSAELGQALRPPPFTLNYEAAPTREQPDSARTSVLNRPPNRHGANADSRPPSSRPPVRHDRSSVRRVGRRVRGRSSPVSLWLFAWAMFGVSSVVAAGVTFVNHEQRHPRTTPPQSDAFATPRSQIAVPPWSNPGPAPGNTGPPTTVDEIRVRATALQGLQVGPATFAFEPGLDFGLGYSWTAYSNGVMVLGSSCQIRAQVSGPETFPTQRTRECSKDVGSPFSGGINSERITVPGEYTITVSDESSGISGQQSITVYGSTPPVPPRA